MMGIAALMVIIVHLWGSSSIPLWLGNIQRFAQNGVDIFLFLSGLGCYYSISKRTVGDFYKHRLARILPSHLIVLTGYMLIECIGWKFSVIESYQYNSIFSFFLRGNTLGWFISSILVLYLITPLLYKLINKSKVAYWMIFTGLLVILSQLGFYTLGDTFYSIYELFLNRIPVYMVGIACGQYIQQNEEKNFKVSSLGFIGLTFGLLGLFFANSFFNTINTMSICHYIAILLAPVYCIWMAAFFNKFNCEFIQEIGKMSLETYLLNEKLAIILYIYLPKSDDYIINLLSFVLTLILGYYLRRVTDGATNKLQYLR